MRALGTPLYYQAILRLPVRTMAVERWKQFTLDQLTGQTRMMEVLATILVLNSLVVTAGRRGRDCVHRPVTTVVVRGLVRILVRQISIYPLQMYVCT